MHIINIAAVTVEDKPYPSLAAKLRELEHWIRHAAARGGQLVVLPETVNVYWEHTPTCVRQAPMYLENWQEECRSLIQLAAELRIAITIPVLYKAGDGQVYNAFFLADEHGEIIGEYRKQFLTPLEVERGIAPGVNRLIEWQGIRIGGAICFDTLYAETYTRQEGMNLLLCPSRWPGGCQLDFYSGIMNFNTVLAYSHWSRIIGSGGKEIVSGGYRNETLRYGFGAPVLNAAINFDRQNYYGNINQEKMVELEAEYGPQIRIVFDQPNCLWTLESLSPDFTIRDLEKRHGLISRQQYLADCAANCRSI